MQQIFVRNFSIILFLLAPFVLLGQQKTLKGMIVVDFKSDTPEGVWIINTTSGVYSVSDLTGSFQIKAAVGDTLHLQGSFLQDRKFYVRSSSFNHDPLVIHMNYEVVMLEDLVVKAPLTGDLRKDIASVKIRDDVEKIYANLGIDIRTLDMDPKEKREAVLPAITSLNVDALYKVVTGYYRRMENLNQFERLEKRLIDVREYLGVKYFDQVIGIPENEIRGFLLYAYDHSDMMYETYYLQQDYLSLDHLFRSLAPEFRKRLEIRDAAE